MESTGTVVDQASEDVVGNGDGPWAVVIGAVTAPLVKLDGE